MKALRNLLDKLHPHFTHGGKFEKFYPLYEAIDTFTYTPGEVTGGAPHVRDAMDLKRVMITVVLALVPCFFMAMWNTGYQANSVMQLHGGSVEGWRGVLLGLLGYSGNPNSMVDNLLLGAAWFVPIYLVTNVVGGLWEALFCIVRRHELNEGFLVTGSLFPLICPPTRIPRPAACSPRSRARRRRRPARGRGSPRLAATATGGRACSCSSGAERTRADASVEGASGAWRRRQACGTAGCAGGAAGRASG